VDVLFVASGIAISVFGDPNVSLLVWSYYEPLHSHHLDISLVLKCNLHSTKVVLHKIHEVEYL